MAFFTYTNEDGSSSITKSFPVGKAPKFIVDNGERFNRDFSIGTNTQRPSCWPMTCDASAVNPKQILQVQQQLASHGLSCDFTPKGQPQYRDAGHAKACLQARGFWHRNAGYGDATPQTNLKEL